MFDIFGDFYQMSVMQSGGDAASYGRHHLAHPLRRNHKKKGGRAKAKRKARSKRRRK